MSKPVKAPVFVAGALIVLAALGVGYAYNANESTQTCTVDEKDRTTNSDGASDARIYTDCGVLRVKDNLFRGIWNSADMYASIDEGETYTFTTIGWRAPILSMFPEIVAVE